MNQIKWNKTLSYRLSHLTSCVSLSTLFQAIDARRVLKHPISKLFFPITINFLNNIIIKQLILKKRKLNINK